MHIVLLTGIYPPQLGGPATYAYNLAKQLHAKGHMVEVITYGTGGIGSDWPVHFVSQKGTFLQRWWRYRQVIKQVAANADVVYSFGTVSEGIPLVLARLTQPKKYLRLGGDFAWERYTDLGGTKSLRDFYSKPPLLWRPVHWLMKRLLRGYDHIVFSTEWQQKIYANSNVILSGVEGQNSTIIENVLQLESQVNQYTLHTPVKLLSMGRLVKFKQINTLLEAMTHLPNCTLAIVGDGPEKSRLVALRSQLQLEDRVMFIDPVRGSTQQNIFAEHDLLVIPSLTDISPNTALEAAANGLPVLITSETGLSTTSLQSMVVKDVSTTNLLVLAIKNCLCDYEAIALSTTVQSMHRSWEQVAGEHVELFSK